MNSWAELNAVGRGDETIKALINLNLSEIEIRSLLKKCGSSRIQRIRKNPNLEEPQRMKPSHALRKVLIQHLIDSPNAERIEYVLCQNPDISSKQGDFWHGKYCYLDPKALKLPRNAIVDSEVEDDEIILNVAVPAIGGNIRCKYS
eukprot:gene16316-22227_t